jgi:membrane fusion protein (multidrug efflux system)
VRIPQRRLAELSLGRPVEIEAETHPGRVFAGRIEAILPVVDPVEGTVEARVAVEDSEGVLRPGAFLTARIILNERPEALLVPKRARLFEGNRSLLFVVRDDKAVRLEIDTGLLTEGEVEVLPASGGLLPEDLVIVRGQSRLRDGEPVAIAASEEELPLPVGEGAPGDTGAPGAEGAPPDTGEAGAENPDAPSEG